MAIIKKGLAEEVEGWSEASRRGAATVAEWASRRSEAEGLGVMWYARSRETTSPGLLASEYIGLVVSARSADHITERQAYVAGTKFYAARTLAIYSSIASRTIALMLPAPPRLRSSSESSLSLST